MKQAEHDLLHLGPVEVLRHRLGSVWSTLCQRKKKGKVRAMPQRQMNGYFLPSSHRTSIFSLIFYS